MSIHPSYLLILKSKDSAAIDLLFHISGTGRRLIEHKPCSMTYEDISVVGYFDDVDGIMSDIYDNHSRGLVNIVQYALRYDREHDLGFSKLVSTCCEAARIRGSVSTLVLCSDRQIRQLTVTDIGQCLFEPFNCSVLYQCGRILSKEEMLKQIRAQHHKNLEAILNLFDPDSQHGFIMPSID